MDQIKKLTEPSRQFTKDSIRLVKRCTKPDRKGKKSYPSKSFGLKFILNQSNLFRNLYRNPSEWIQKNILISFDAIR